MRKGTKILVIVTSVLALAACGSETGTPKEVISDVRVTGKVTQEATSEGAKEVKDSVLEKKYASYMPYEYASETCKTWQVGEEAEEEVSKWYGTWYDEAGEAIEFTKERFDNREYGVKRCYVDVYPEGTRRRFSKKE